MNPYVRASQKFPSVQSQALERLASRVEKSKGSPERVQRLKAKSQELKRVKPSPRERPVRPKP